MRLVLASASPRRAQVLDEMEVEFEVDISRFDEDGLIGLGPRAHAVAAARGKAEEVRRRRPQDWVVGVDTVVARDGLLRGQPADAGDATRMLRLLSGRSHSVISGVRVASPRG